MRPLLLWAALLASPAFAQEGRHLVAYSDFDDCQNVSRQFHAPTYHAQNPVFEAERPWEFNANGDPYAAPFSGGVWYDETAQKFKMWYSAGGGKTDGLVTCYAESDDGKRWTRPALDVVRGTNIVDTAEHDCVSVILDKFEPDPARRYKMFCVQFNRRATVSMHLRYSPDGIHWGETRALSGELYDRCAAYYDPFRRHYVLSLKTINGEVFRRSRAYLAGGDPELIVSLAHRVYDNRSDKFIRYWFNAEDDDPRHPLFPGIRPQIYNHEAMPYERSLLGYFTIWQGPENDACDSLKIQKRNEVLLGWADDGFHWRREFKVPFLAVDEDFDAWNAGNVQSVAGCPVIVGDSLYFYVSGRHNSKPLHDSNFATGLATLRRDGFVSLRAGATEGVATSRPMVVDGDHLFVNADARRGWLTVEVLDESGAPVPGFGAADCHVVRRVDSTRREVMWRGGRGLAELRGRDVRLRFRLSEADLYSFWMSPWPSGESGGYTAGGGPGLPPTGRDVPTNRRLP